MKVNRIRQFFIQLTDKMSSEDYSFVKNYLNKEELRLFKGLSRSEQKHCVRVARGLERNCIRDNMGKGFIEEYIRLGLLHDVGKTLKRINIVQKSILVVVNKATKERLKKFTNIKIVDGYYNHGEKGYNILKDKNYSRMFLKAVRYHHNIKYNEGMVQRLREVDDKN